MSLSATLTTLTAALGESFRLGEFTCKRFAVELANNGSLPADPRGLVSPQDAALFIHAAAAAPSPSEAADVLAGYIATPLAYACVVEPSGAIRHLFQAASGFCDPEFNPATYPENSIEALAALLALPGLGPCPAVSLMLSRPPSRSQAILSVTNDKGQTTRTVWRDDALPESVPGFELSAQILGAAIGKVGALLHRDNLEVTGAMEAGA